MHFLIEYSVSEEFCTKVKKTECRKASQWKFLKLNKEFLTNLDKADLRAGTRHLSFFKTLKSLQSPLLITKLRNSSLKP